MKYLDVYDGLLMVMFHTQPTGHPTAPKFIMRIRKAPIWRTVYRVLENHKPL